MEQNYGTIQKSDIVTTNFGTTTDDNISKQNLKTLKILKILTRESCTKTLRHSHAEKT